MAGAGERLKKLRLEKGLSLEEVQKKTKIHLNILKAMEGDTITNLSQIYLKGFLKIYCKFLGVDPKDYISDYKETQSQAAVIGSADKKWQKKVSPLRETAINIGSFRPSKKLKTAVSIILGVIILSLALFNLGKIISAKQSRNNLIQERVSLKAVITAESKQKKAQATTQKSAVTEISLVMSAKERCYAVVKVDGRVVFQRTLERGRSDSWKAKEKIELTLGNAGAVELIVNGQRFDKLGKRGQPRKNIVITKEGLSFGR